MKDYNNLTPIHHGPIGLFSLDFDASKHLMNNTNKYFLKIRYIFEFFPK